MEEESYKIRARNLSLGSGYFYEKARVFRALGYLEVAELFEKEAKACFEHEKLKRP